MKVAIPTTGKGWDSLVHESFAHAPIFFIIDDRRAHVHTLDNPYLHATECAGKQVAKMVADLGVQIAITHHCEEQGAEALQQAGVRLITGVQGTVDLVYRRFYHGLLGNQCEPEPCTTCSRPASPVSGA